MKHLLAILSVVILAGSCHQAGVLLRDPKPYKGVLKDPTLVNAKVEVSTHGCTEGSCFAHITIKPTVVNPTEYTIFPKLRCVYSIDNWNGFYEAGVRNIKPFKVNSYSSRIVWIDNMLIVPAGMASQIGVACTMDLSLAKMPVTKYYKYVADIDVSKLPGPTTAMHPLGKQACDICTTN